MSLLPSTLDTRRLRLRKPLASDAVLIFAAYGQDADVTRYMIWRPHVSVGQTEEFVAGCLRAWEGEHRLPYVIVRKDYDEPIGMIDIQIRGDMIEIGYVLAKREWGQGLMPEAIQALVAALSAIPQVHRVQATCDVDNLASQRALEKSGFLRERRIERHIVHPNISDDPRPCWLYARSPPVSPDEAL